MSMSSSMSSRTLEFLVSPTDEDRTFSLSLPSAEELNISEEEERSTAAAFVGCVSEAAQSDRGRRISVDHARTLILRPQTGTSLFSGYTVGYEKFPALRSLPPVLVPKGKRLRAIYLCQCIYGAGMSPHIRYYI